jgi:hypothetical protein
VMSRVTAGIERKRQLKMWMIRKKMKLIKKYKMVLVLCGILYLLESQGRDQEDIGQVQILEKVRAHVQVKKAQEIQEVEQEEEQEVIQGRVVDLVQVMF